MTTTLERLSAKIREGNPQLMELKEGCRVEHEVHCFDRTNTPQHTMYLQKGIITSEEQKIIHSSDDDFEMGHQVNWSEVVPTKLITIIGCPIHLEHVMNALEGVGEINGHDVQAITMDVRNKEIHIVLYGGIGILIDYDTSKDFTQQTPETHEKLLELLTIAKH